MMTDQEFQLEFKELCEARGFTDSVFIGAMPSGAIFHHSQNVMMGHVAIGMLEVAKGAMLKGYAPYESIKASNDSLSKDEPKPIQIL